MVETKSKLVKGFKKITVARRTAKGYTFQIGELRYFLNAENCKVSLMPPFQQKMCSKCGMPSGSYPLCKECYWKSKSKGEKKND